MAACISLLPADTLQLSRNPPHSSQHPALHQLFAGMKVGSPSLSRLPVSPGCDVTKGRGRGRGFRSEDTRKQQTHRWKLSTGVLLGFTGSVGIWPGGANTSDEVAKAHPKRPSREATEKLRAGHLSGINFPLAIIYNSPTCHHTGTTLPPLSTEWFTPHTLPS